MNTVQIVILVLIIVVAILVGLFFLGRKLQKKMDQQQTMINEHKMVASILVIDKKKMKITEANLPKVVVSQIPKFYKFKKMPMVKAKIGPQITTLLCDNKVFKTLPTKRMIKVELAGIYIVGYKGYKGAKGSKNATDKKAKDIQQVQRKIIRKKK